MLTVDQFLDKLQEQSISEFTLPNSGLTIKYRKLDIIESSVHGDLPTYLSNRVLEGMKSSLAGVNSTSDDNVNPSEEDLKNLIEKSSTLLAKNIVDPPLTLEQITGEGTRSGIDSQDRLAWLMHAMLESQEGKTEGGGTVSAEAVATFPEQADQGDEFSTGYTPGEDL